MTNLTEKYLKLYEKNWIEEADTYLSGIDYDTDCNSLGEAIKLARELHRDWFMNHYQPMSEIERQSAEIAGRSE